LIICSGTFLLSSLFYVSCGLGGGYNLQKHGDALRWATRIFNCGLGIEGGGAETEAIFHLHLTFKITLLKITQLTITVTQLCLQIAFVYTQI
jgi:hypothetical protein